MARCIFCLNSDGGFSTREHILPESLGGGDWALLPPGLYCDRCQNRFGSNIEQQALDQYPFPLLRVLLGIPTKKGKAPWMRSPLGVLKANPYPGLVGLDPIPAVEDPVADGIITQVRLLAEPTKPSFICRTLLKMGLEVVAADRAGDAFEERFNAARTFALTGEKSGPWWFLQQEDMEAARRFILGGVSRKEWVEGVRLETLDVGGAEVFRLGLLYLDLVVPLEPRIIAPPMGDLPSPEFRLFVV